LCTAQIWSIACADTFYEDCAIWTKSRDRLVFDAQKVFLTTLTGNGKLAIRLGAREVTWWNLANIGNNTTIRKAAEAKFW